MKNRMSTGLFAGTLFALTLLVTGCTVEPAHETVVNPPDHNTTVVNPPSKTTIVNPPVVNPPPVVVNPPASSPSSSPSTSP